MRKSFKSLKIGVLGGGQLARMLILEGHRLGFEMHVLSTQSTDPAAQVTGHWHQGDPKVRSAVSEFISQVDLVTFESEFLDGLMLAELSQEQHKPIKPDPLIMEQLQDRLSQKDLLRQHGIPTAPYLNANQLDVQDLMRQFANGFVLKKRRFGYDGYGTYIIQDSEDLQHLENKMSLQKAQDTFIAETFMPFKRELAALFARSASGRVIEFPLVETRQKDARCFWVKGPARHAQWSKFKSNLIKFIKSIKYEGVIAFELFDLGKDLFVNEIAPRVHNSAHYSLNALSTSQFAMHLLAIADAPIKSPSLIAPGFAMVNILGEGHSHAELPLNTDGFFMHWYGKSECREGRKMGHINTLNTSADKALTMALKARRGMRA